MEHMRKQAKRSAKLHHLDLVDAQHRVAPEYGSKNRASLLHYGEGKNRGADQIANVKHKIEALPATARARNLDLDLDLVGSILASDDFPRYDLDAALARVQGCPL